MFWAGAVIFGEFGYSCSLQLIVVTVVSSDLVVMFSAVTVVVWFSVLFSKRVVPVAVAIVRRLHEICKHPASNFSTQGFLSARVLTA